MKLTKAIEILDFNVKSASKKMPPDVLDALKLSIEALERIKKERLLGNIHPNDSLSGETKD